MKKTLDKIIDSISSILLVVTSILVFTQAILRYFFSYSIHWSEEVSLLMIVWFIFLGCSVAAKEGAHISMDMLDNILPDKGRQIISVIINIISVGFCVIIVYAGIGMVKNAIELDSMATSIEMPLWIAYTSVPVGMTLMLIQYIFKLVDSIKALKEEGRNEVRK